MRRKRWIHRDSSVAWRLPQNDKSFMIPTDLLKVHNVPGKATTNLHQSFKKCDPTPIMLVRLAPKYRPWLQRPHPTTLV
jgi:hypothetical protein